MGIGLSAQCLDGRKGTKARACLSFAGTESQACSGLQAVRLESARRRRQAGSQVCPTPQMSPHCKGEGWLRRKGLFGFLLVPESFLTLLLVVPRTAFPLTVTTAHLLGCV